MHSLGKIILIYLLQNMIRRDFVFQITVLLNWKQENFITPGIIRTRFQKGQHDLYVPEKFLRKYEFDDGEDVVYYDEIVLQNIGAEEEITEKMFRSYTSCLKYLSTMKHDS